MIFDYSDCYEKKLSENNLDASDIVVALFFRSPIWISFLFKLRNLIMLSFGFDSSIPSHEKRNLAFKAGEKVKFFDIYSVEKSKIILGLEEKHLDFEVHISVVDNSFARVETFVKFNNFFGKLYFYLIMPFHILIIKNLLNRMKFSGV